MPLSVKARVEIYLPDQPGAIYSDLLKTIVKEFTTSFGGCSVKRGIEGSYFANRAEIIAEPITVVYSDTPFHFQNNLEKLTLYADELREYAFRALDEEEILVAVWPVYHSR